MEGRGETKGGKRIRDRIYDHDPWRLLKLSYVLLFASWVLDILPCPYLHPCIETFFAYDSGDVITVILVIWTFTATLLVFYMGKKDDHCYGIRMYDALKRKYTQEKGPLWMVVAFLTEIAVLMVAAGRRWPITIMVFGVIQVVNMLYVFGLICDETSEETILKRVRGEFLDLMEKGGMGHHGPENGELDDLLLVRMIKAMDYSDMAEADRLLGVLNAPSKCMGNTGSAADRKTEGQKDIWHWEVSKRLARYILEASGGTGHGAGILTAWSMEESSTLEVKKGILVALLEYADAERSDNVLQICHKLLRIERDHQNELYIWCILYQEIKKCFADEKWRWFDAKWLYGARNRTWGQEDRKIALVFWRELSECDEVSKDGQDWEWFYRIFADGAREDI